MALVPAIVDVAKRTIGKPSRVKTETAILANEGAISYYEDGLFTLSGQPKGEGELGERARTIIAALKKHLAFLQDEVLPAVRCAKLADRQGEIRPQARAGARRRPHGR